MKNCIDHAVSLLTSADISSRHITTILLLTLAGTIMTSARSLINVPLSPYWSSNYRNSLYCSTRHIRCGSRPLSIRQVRGSVCWWHMQPLACHRN